MSEHANIGMYDNVDNKDDPLTALSSVNDQK